MQFDYFYGDEAEQFTFYRIPKALITSQQFKKVSDSAKLLYGLMLDRMGLSIRNGWFDEQNRAYIFFTVNDIMEQMNCKTEKATKLVAELKGIGLIERVKQGQGKPSKIYLKKFISSAFFRGNGEAIFCQQIPYHPRIQKVHWIYVSSVCNEEKADLCQALVARVP